MDYLQTVQSVFSGRMFRIPDYQRGYAWEERQWVDLVEDLEVLTEGKGHFTGTLVLCKAPNGGKMTDNQGDSYDLYDGIDGQQRLTTVVILLDAIRREMANTASLQDVATGLQRRYIAVKDRHGQPLPKLRLNRDNHDFFFKTVLHQDTDLLGPTMISHQRLAGAKAYFAGYLAQQRESRGPTYADWLEQIHTKISGHMQLLVYTVDSEADAGVIFETMNDRGKPITEVEKVKNHLLYLASKLGLQDGHELVECINETWTRVFEYLMRARLVRSDDEDRLLRFHWLMAYDYQIKEWKESRSVKDYFSLRRYEDRPNNLLQDVQRYIDTLGNAAVAYADVYNPTHALAFNSFDAHGDLRRQVVEANEKLVRMNLVAPFLPLLMAVRLAHPQQGAVYLQAVELCERFAFRVYSWRSLPSSIGQYRLFRLGYELFTGHTTLEATLNELRRAILEYCPDRLFVDRFRAEVNWYDWSGLKYLLYEYEQYLGEKNRLPVRLLWSDVDRRKKHETIEHILPQHPETPGYWTDHFTAEQREKYTHDLGNLCLTQHNPELGNMSFPEKVGKPGEQSGYLNSIVLMEKALAGYDDWTESQLIERRRQIEEWASVRWHVDPPAPPPVGDEKARIQSVLTRRPVPPGQRQLYKALYEAGDEGLSMNDLAATMGRPIRQLAGVLGALGNRINGTERPEPDTNLGIGLMLRVESINGQWHYWLRPVFRELLEAPSLSYLNLLA
jgi:hypothetical protein